MNEIDQLTMAKVQHQILVEIGATDGSEVLSTREALGGRFESHEERIVTC